MPAEDIEGDVMGIVVTSHADAIGLTTGASLGTALSQAYDLQGSYYPQRYNLFAQHYGLVIDPQTNTFTVPSREAFIESNQNAVAAYGSVLFVREHPWFDYMFLASIGALTDARKVLTMFLNDVEAGLVPAVVD